jgi:hypothetical protein
MTLIGAGGLAYRWDDLDPAPLGRPDEWVHPGLAALGTGGARAFNQSTGDLVDLDADGRVTRRLRTGILCGHAIAIGAGDRTWVADPGMRAWLVDGTVARDERPGGVVAVDPGGRTLLELVAPPLPAYRERQFRPTSVALERPDAVDSPIWVADGYGGGTVSRWSPDGRLLAWLDSTPRAGPFDVPHAVAIDRRGPEPTLLVADRGNAVVHRFDLDGRHVATIGGGALTTPSAFVLAGDVLLVAELDGRIAVLDPEDRVVGYLGDGSDVRGEAGWPNRRDGNRTVRREPHQAGRFVSPHGLTALADGRLLVAEWRIGGRLVRLTPIPPGRARA